MEILNLSITHSQGSAIFMINVCSKALVQGSRFLNNNLKKVNGVRSEFYIEYNHCETAVMNGTETLISNSTFIHNQIVNYTIGGLSVKLNVGASNISLSIKESAFSSAAGSGLSVYLLNTSNNNSVTVCLTLPIMLIFNTVTITRETLMTTKVIIMVVVLFWHLITIHLTT